MHYTRIIHNTANYQKPSGDDGKSNSNSTFEGVYKFGWDEWLFNKKFILDGYQYGFIQGFARNNNKRIGCLYLLSYSNGKWTYLGKLSKFEVLTDLQVKKIKADYVQKGWWKDMKVNLDKEQNKIADCLFKCGFHNIVNVRFKNVHLIKPTKKIEYSEKLNTRYGIYKVDPKLKNFLTQTI